MSPSTPTVHEVWRESGVRLASAAVTTTTPELDARVILCHVLGITLTGLVTRFREPFPPDRRNELSRLLERRAQGEPVAWLTGVQEFRGLDFSVGEGVLVPRADTETLVEAALEVALKSSGPLRFVDVCTGSACVAVALANELPASREVEAHAVDLSPQALEFARRNANLVEHGRELVLHEGNLLRDLEGPWDLIVSNPPYLTPSETAERVGPSGWKEPALALDGGGADGLALIEELVLQAHGQLNLGGWLLLEAADAQMDRLTELLGAPNWVSTRLWKDLAGQRRVIGACRAPRSHQEGR